MVERAEGFECAEHAAHEGEQGALRWEHGLSPVQEGDELSMYVMMAKVCQDAERYDGMSCVEGALVQYSP